MRIAAISDLHIGASATADTFRHREDEFLEFLDRLEGEHDRIVLLGDVFQTDHSWLPGRREATRQLLRAQARAPRLWQRVQQSKYVRGVVA